MTECLLAIYAGLGHEQIRHFGVPEREKREVLDVIVANKPEVVGSPRQVSPFGCGAGV